jgi:VanZ family protein
VRWAVRVCGFLIGAGLALVGILGLHAMYKGAWMPLALAAAIGVFCSFHPRLASAPATSWWVGVFLFLSLSVWMRSSQPVSLRNFQDFVRLVPGVCALFALPLLAIMLRRNSAAAPAQVLYLPAALLVLLIGLSIVYLSGSKGGPDPMVRFFMENLGFDERTAQSAVVLFRKTIHFAVYGMLGWAAYRLANPRFDLRAAIMFGLGIAASFAIFDEFRQTAATNRSGSVWDIGLDLLGCLTFIGISVLRYHRKSQPVTV